jgi:hypothetical protein
VRVKPEVEHCSLEKSHVDSTPARLSSFPQFDLINDLKVPGIVQLGVGLQTADVEPWRRQGGDLAIDHPETCVDSSPPAGGNVLFGRLDTSAKLALLPLLAPPWALRKGNHAPGVKHASSCMHGSVGVQLNFPRSSRPPG